MIALINTQNLIKLQPRDSDRRKNTGSYGLVDWWVLERGEDWCTVRFKDALGQIKIKDQAFMLEERLLSDCVTNFLRQIVFENEE